MTTAHQTAGPYWHLIDFPEWADLLRDAPGATAITLAGRITDGTGAPVADAMVEIWQADAAGLYGAGFHGFGRCATDAEGRFRFRTQRPGPVPGRGNTLQAPHVQVAIFARGLLAHLTTRLYFAGEPMNETDPLLALVPAERRATLLAREATPGEWCLDIRLQGENETVFLDI
jgi:protocatechuate 3,4-dioxygenase, alpha subunit